MKLRLATSLIIAFFAYASNGYAQNPIPSQTPTPLPRLKGKVVLVNNSNPKDVKIRINAKDMETRRMLGGKQDQTEVEDWYREAQLGTLLLVSFDPPPCYEGDSHEPTRVQRENRDLPTMELQKTRQCQLLEEMQERSRSRGSSKSTSTGTGTKGAATANARAAANTNSRDDAAATSAKMKRYEYELPESESGVIKIDRIRDANLIPSPKELRQQLEAEAVQARNGEFFDTFQYKFALKSELYRDIPELTKVLTEFRKRQTNADLFQPIGKVRAEMFNDVIRREFQTSEQINLDNIKLVMEEDSVSPNIRGSATVALLNEPLKADFLNDFRSYHRQQTPSSPIWETSLIALGRIGEDQDKAKLYEYVVDKNGSQRIVAMEALALAQLIEGPETLPAGSKTLASVATGEDDSIVRAFAVRSLRPFASQQDETAVQTLFFLARDPDPVVRLQAALALGVGEVDHDQRVRNRLRRIAATDRCPLVRYAAQLSLRGTNTTDILLPSSTATIECK